MPMYIDDFEILFQQLQTIGIEFAVSEKHKAPFLIASMGNESLLEKTLAALRLRDVLHCPEIPYLLTQLRNGNDHARVRKRRKRQVVP